MLFNSYEFIFVFLPATLAGFFLLGARSPRFALAWLILASLCFYAWWRPVNVGIIAPSILINYALARWLLRLAADKSRAGLAGLVLAAGIVFNVAFLGYFKYVNFLATTVNDLAGTNFVLTQVVLPLGISFITFQKIAFLIDVHGRHIREFSLRDFALFVLFFPQLIAGPIVHYREMIPQFQQASCRIDKEGVAVGLSLFVLGLFKKVVLADGISEHVSPLYDMAAAGTLIPLFQAWTAAIGFTLQIYFDFSGYSDMALGLARLFGVRLPANFDSPLKATNIIDFWLRWHMTLTRFLTAYLYNPLVLWLTRRRMASRRPGLGVRSPDVGAFFQVLVGPTLLTMLVSGIWHGAGYLFVLWGLLHGVYLSINHGWRLYGAARWPDKQRYLKFMRPVGFVLTFVAVAFAMVVFRSVNAGSAENLLGGMVGLNGASLPKQIFDRLGPVAAMLQPFLSASSTVSATEFAIVLLWLGGLLAIALLLPNSLQIMGDYGPAAGHVQRSGAGGRLERALRWSPSLPWACAMSVLAVVSIMKLGGKSEFLYWQF